MSVRVSFPFALVLIGFGFFALTQYAAVPNNLVEPALKEPGQQAAWPKTSQLVFDSGSKEPISALNGSELLGSNRSFTTPACSRLKFAAERGGETYAGHLMRRRMRFGTCARYLATGGKFWEWPWQDGLPRADLPPHNMGQFGAWQLRCEDRTAIRRCALVQFVKPAGRPAPEIITHFTMASFNGKLVPVWRLFALRTDASWYSGLTPEEARGWGDIVSRCVRQKERFSSCMRGARDRFKGRKTREIWFTLGQSVRNLDFTKCTPSGCMIEAPIDLAARAFGEFGKGNDVFLKLHPLGDMGVKLEVRGDGFVEALHAFSNIDRTQISVQADHRREAL